MNIGGMNIGGGDVPVEVHEHVWITTSDGTRLAARIWRPADDAVVARLVTLAQHHDDALVREAAVAALGSLGDERGLPAILRGCTDKAPVRRRAVLALAPFDGPEVRAALRAACADRDWQVRQSAEDLAAIIGLDDETGDA